MTGDRNYVNLHKTCLEKLLKSIQVNLFLAVFSYLEQLCDYMQEIPQLGIFTNLFFCHLACPLPCIPIVINLYIFFGNNVVWWTFQVQTWFFCKAVKWDMFGCPYNCCSYMVFHCFTIGFSLHHFVNEVESLFLKS